MGESLTCLLCVWREERWVTPFLALRVDCEEIGESSRASFKGGSFLYTPIVLVLKVGVSLTLLSCQF